jgi:hypothetical protein
MRSHAYWRQVLAHRRTSPVIAANMQPVALARTRVVTPDSMLLCSSHYLLKSAPSTRVRVPPPVRHAGPRLGTDRRAIANAPARKSVREWTLSACALLQQQLCDALPAAGRASSRTNVQGHGGFSGVWLTAK